MRRFSRQASLLLGLLLAPWLAGVIYDLEGEYATAVTYVAIAAGLAVLVSLALPRAKHAVEAK